MTTTDTPGAMGDGVPESGAAATSMTTPPLSPSALRRRRRRQIMAGWLAVGVLAGAAITYVGHHGIYRWGWLAPLGGPSVPGTVQGPKILTWRDAAGVVRRTRVDGAR